MLHRWHGMSVTVWGNSQTRLPTQQNEKGLGWAPTSPDSWMRHRWTFAAGEQMTLDQIIFCSSVVLWKKGGRNTLSSTGSTSVSHWPRLRPSGWRGNLFQAEDCKVGPDSMLSASLLRREKERASAPLPLLVACCDQQRTYLDLTGDRDVLGWLGCLG